MKSSLSLVLSFLLFVCGSVHAQTSEQPGWFKQTTDSAVNKIDDMYNNGRLSMTLSGDAHHGRGTYTPEKLKELNEKVWGFGVSKEMRDEKDNEESLQFILMADSHYKPQILASYNYQWMLPLAYGWEVGAGFAAGLGSRSDILGGLPFPGVLPLASIGTRDTKLVMSYIPRLSGTGNGDVLFLGLRIALK